MESRGAAHGDIVISYRSTESGQRGWDSGGYISQNGGDGMANKFEYKVVDVNTIRDIEPVLNRPGGEGWKVVSHAVAGASLYSVILTRPLG